MDKFKRLTYRRKSLLQSLKKANISPNYYTPELDNLMKSSGYSSKIDYDEFGNKCVVYERKNCPNLIVDMK